MSAKAPRIDCDLQTLGWVPGSGCGAALQPVHDVVSSFGEDEEHDQLDQPTRMSCRLPSVLVPDAADGGLMTAADLPGGAAVLGRT